MNAGTGELLSTAGAVGIGANDIGVVVVTHDSATTIGECLARLLAARDVFRIVVIDNASTDDTVAVVRHLATRDERLSLVVNEDNRGFAAGCNQGATAFAQPWIAFVNPDAYVERDTLSRLVRHARERPGAGLLGVEMADPGGATDPASRRADPSLVGQLLTLGRRDDLYLGRDPALVLQAVDAVSGALMLLPTGLFIRLGGFDEGYRLHAEDLDLCRRVRDAGYEVVIANDLRVVHVRGVSGRRQPVRVSWHKHRGLWRYFRKFEAPGMRGWWWRPAIWLALWLHFLGGVPALAWRRRRAGAGRRSGDRDGR